MKNKTAEFYTPRSMTQALNTRILAQAEESQSQRIDHFLRKETVQSIMAMRFANGPFEPMWRQEYIDHVQITAAETVGVKRRGSFYQLTEAVRTKKAQRYDPADSPSIQSADVNPSVEP